MKIECLYDELVDVSKIKAHPKNPNKHDRDQIERLAKILDYQGWRYPVKVSKLTGFVTSGHGRIEAAKKNGWKQIPVNYQAYENEDQEYADVVSDNAIADWSVLDLAQINFDIPALGPDFNIEFLGIKDFVVEPADKIEPQSEEDSIPEHVEPTTQPGDVWVLGRHRLMCGDSTSIDAVETLLGKTKADLVYTDPPYGINEKGDRTSRGGVYPRQKYEDFKDDSTQYAIDAYHLAEGLSIPIQVWWGANYYCHSLPQSNNWLVWDKRVDENQTDQNSDCELAWVKSDKNSIRIFRHLWKGMIKASEKKEKRVHPTQKPVELAVHAFERYAPEAKAVLDLFGGSGSTLIACEKTNRTCFMMELNPKYCDVIVARWEKYTGETAEQIITI